MSRKLILFPLFIVVGFVFYYSWLPDPSFKNESYLPKWLLDWSNDYYNLRTALPFIAFGYLLETYSQKKTLYKMDVNRNLIFIQNLGVAAIVAFIAECGQFLIKDRNPDLMDIYFGIIGSLIGALVHNLFNKIRLKNAK
ncbi:VanZ family protein [Flavobacterium aquicola]|uniref:VanZ like protein n=1 Tax=Flavobacterium aquicola TaxID=1682742 RepID=A0A3E0EXM6_9FLAO|nr:VanZ family protein [Flavobacterium aquicola]REH01907.1 VanZ like protein [Flavobacterium aquicola]